MKNQRPTIAAILSQKSRTGSDAEETVRAALKSSGVFVVSTSTIDRFKESIRRARGMGVDQVWIGGGDGSIRLAANELLGSDLPIGILPLGTGNSLARELGIPLKLEDAIELFMGEPQELAIDVGLFDEKPFVNVATIGLTTAIAREVSGLPKGSLGRLVYVPAFLRALRQCRPFWARVKTPEELFEGRIIQFVAGSGRLHAGPFPVTQTASIVDGKLSLYAVRYEGPGSILRYCSAMVLGKHEELPNVWSAEVSEAVVTLARSRYFVVDGDRARSREAKLGIRAGGLRVLVPRV